MAIPPVERLRGVTVFGITLTRRQTAIGVAILLALVLMLVFAVSAAFGSDGDGGSDAKAGPTAAATTPAAPEPTTPAQQKPSSAPPSSSAPPAFALPSGWYMYEDRTGFAVPLPKGWRVEQRGSEVYFYDNTPEGRLLIIDQTDRPKADPVRDWTEKESDRRRGYINYRRLAIRPVTYWDEAADWEFTRTSSTGNPLRVVKRGFITADDQAYSIAWSTSLDDWDRFKKDLQTIYDGFRPAKS